MSAREPSRTHAPPSYVASPTHRAVIDALIAERRKAGLTQRDLAQRIGKPQSFVSKVEGVERNLSVLELIGWAAALGIDPGSVLVRPDGPIEI